jgi:cell division protein FtsQ
MLKKPRSFIGFAKAAPGEPKHAEIRQRNRTLLRGALITTLTADCALVVLLVYLLFLYSSYFNLQQVEVLGNRHLSRAEVVEASELESGINLLTVDLAAITERLKRQPWIRSASVYRRFPGQLIIEIEERTPKAILAAGKLYYVDFRAEFFTRLLPGDPVDLPLFTGLKAEDLQSAGPEVKEMIRRGLNLLETVERASADLNPSSIAEVRIDPDEGVSLFTRSGQLVVLGKSDFDQKVQRYGRLKKFLIQRGEWQSARIINLDFEDRAVVRRDKAHLQG